MSALAARTGAVNLGQGFPDAEGPAFLVEALRVVDTDEISLELTAPNRPGLLRAGPNFLYVIMPVNLT